MNRLVISIVLAIPAVASADKNFMGNSGTWDCSKDSTVNINTGKGKYTFTGKCETINVNGGENTITAGAVGTINVSGGKNVIDTDELGSVNIVGASNKITYKKAGKGDKPGTSIVGAGNTVTKAAGGGGKGDGKGDGGGKGDGTGGGKGDKKDEGAGGGNDGNRAIIDCKKTPTWSTGNGDGHFKFVGACTKISVGGGDNDLYIESVETLSVGGGDNNIFLVAVGTIDVGGADNKITWKKALKGDKPILKGQPSKNKIVQLK